MVTRHAHAQGTASPTVWRWIQVRKLPRLLSRAGSDFIVRGTSAACRPDCPATRRIDSGCPAYVAQARVAWARQVQAVANPPRYPE